MMHDPVKPPKIAWKSNALPKIIPNIVPRFFAFITSTTIEISTYATPITGTRTPVTLVSFLAPPRMITAKSTARMIPMIIGVVFS